MDRVLHSAIQAVLGLQGATAYAVIGLLAFSEAAVFLGLVSPGEVSMVLGGVLAAEGRVTLGGMVATAGVAAVLGDSAGYWVGRRWGTRLLSWGPVQRRYSDRISRVRQRFRDKGGWAIVVGRWASVVRTFIPFAAGSARMPYPRFLLFSVPSATVWAVSFVLLGFVAGQSWDVVEKIAGRAAFILLLVLAIGLLIRASARRVIQRQDQLLALAARLGATRPVRWVRERYGDELRWLGRRFDPRIARGLSLTLGFVVLAFASIAAGVVFSDVHGFEGIARLDRPVRQWFADVETEAAVAIANVVTTIFDLPWVAFPILLVAAFAAVWVTWRAAIRVMVGAFGTAASAWLVQQVITERIPGTRWPSLPIAIAGALLVHAVAAAVTRLRWAAAVTTMAVGAFVVALVGLADLVTAEGTLTGVLFGAAFGAAWAAAVELQARLPFRLLG
ncbi:MAG: DedA family protein, partial [Actinomycetota bacterium]|nr:DedA family protein [Actinomycetota bacterium]